MTLEKPKPKRLLRLKNWREIFNPISKRSKGNSNRVVTFDSHLKTVPHNM